MNFKHGNYSWHHEITHFPALIVDGYISPGDKKKDFCSYTRWFLWKLLVVIPLTTIIVGGYLGCYFAGWANLFTDMPSFGFFRENNMVWFLTNAFVAAVSLVAAFFWLFEYLKEKHDDVKFIKESKYQSDLSQGLIEKKQPSFLYTWYLKFINKFCPRMDY